MPVAFDQIRNRAGMSMAPMKMNSAIAGTLLTSPVSSLAMISSSLPLPLLEHARAKLHRYVRSSRDLIDKVLRHRFGERLTAHDHGNLFGKSREIHRRLSRRIAGANNVSILVRA